ncbi:G2/mitotic-specific cyclin-A-like [Oppia nitens]|uniref:G2/mitotic-specific cyclin-A-like n=1 Tax=Oppia nitens TaxID=1686743 RepID=UPI0023DBC36C|nr:G2/mitotic-specific cyclin-A-like [Oppia nitens]
MAQITNENLMMTTINDENQQLMANKANHKATERRILGPILPNVLRPNVAAKGKPLALQTKQWTQNTSNGNILKTSNTSNVVKPSNATVKINPVLPPHKSSDFEIFCDESQDSEMNDEYEEEEEEEEENDENREDMDLTDHMLSERTENSLAIEEAVIQAFHYSEVKCEESLDLESDEEELEDESTSEQNSELITNTFDATALSRCKEYAEEIHKYLMFIERKCMADPCYISKQPEINAKMRSILIDWMVEVTEEYKLHDQTLFFAVNYIDRFLSHMSISRQSFQLLGTAALFIASKYEEIYPPDLSEFVYITDDSYTKHQILNMEKLILKALDFEISAPTTYYFVEKLLTQLDLISNVKYLAKYLCFLTLLESEPFLRFYPSEIAICCIILSAHTLGFPQLINAKFIQDSLSYENDLKGGSVVSLLADRKRCIEALLKMHAFAAKHPQQAIQTKYSNDKYYRVASVEPMVIAPNVH